MDQPLVIENLSFRYRGRASKKNKTNQEPKLALDAVSFSVEPAQVFGLLGPNGGGKTTLFKILSTLHAPQSGLVKIFGVDLARSPEEVRRMLGVVFQAPSLDKKLTVTENLIHQGHLYGLSGSLLKDKVRELLNRVGLTPKSDEFVETLSGGQQRRVEIAKGLLHAPQLLLMDEPTTGLDPGARRDFWEYIFELKKSGMTILVTTHLMEEAEKCDRVAILSEGKVVALGTPKSLKDEIGGDVISVETEDPQGFSARIKERFGIEGVILDHKVHIERDRGHEFVPELAQAFAQEMISVTVSRPSLEDVFVRRTGHKFWKESEG